MEAVEAALREVTEAQLDTRGEGDPVEDAALRGSVGVVWLQCAVVPVGSQEAQTVHVGRLAGHNRPKPVDAGVGLQLCPAPGDPPCSAALGTEVSDVDEPAVRAAHSVLSIRVSDHTAGTKNGPQTGARSEQFSTRTPWILADGFMAANSQPGCSGKVGGEGEVG